MSWEVGLELLQFVLLCAIALYTHMVARHRVTEREMEEHRSAVTRALNGLGERVTRVEEAGRHAPTHDHLGDVYGKLDAVNGKLSEVVGELSGMQVQLRMITEHLLEK